MCVRNGHTVLWGFDHITKRERCDDKDVGICSMINRSSAFQNRSILAAKDRQKHDTNV